MFSLFPSLCEVSRCSHLSKMDASVVGRMKYIETTTSVNGETSLDIDICVVIYFGI